MTTPTSPMAPPKADLNHDLDNNQKQKANQADMPGKPMKLDESAKKSNQHEGDSHKKAGQHDGDSHKKSLPGQQDMNKRSAPSERDTGKTNDAKEVSSHAEKPNHSGKEGKSRT